MEEVHAKHAQWTWAHFAARRDARRRYVALYKQKLPAPLKPLEQTEFDALERKLSYEDLRFYRSLARSELRKDLATRRKLEEERAKERAQAGWLGWVWGSGAKASSEEILGVQMNDQRRKELFDALDYDERAALAATLEPPKDAVKMRIAASLNKGSLTLRADPHTSKKEIMALVFGSLHADVLQRPDNFEADVTLGNLHLTDGDTEGSLYPEIVRVKQITLTRPATPTATITELEKEAGAGETKEKLDQFSQPIVVRPPALLSVKFEQNPLDGRADTALTVKLRPMEIIYHKGYVEAIYNFFKPPESQMESIAALMVCCLLWLRRRVLETYHFNFNRMWRAKQLKGLELRLERAWSMLCKTTKESM